jgi:hypothetical protein
VRNLNMPVDYRDDDSGALPNPCCTLHSVHWTAFSNDTSTASTATNSMNNSTTAVDDELVEPVRENVIETLQQAKTSAFYVGRVIPSTLNPTWQLDDEDLPVDCAEAVAVALRVWCDERLVLTQLLPLPRLAYVSDTFETLAVSTRNAAVLLLRDGLYMLPHHMLGMQAQVQQVQTQLAARYALRSRRECADACSLSALVEIEQRATSLATSLHEAEKMARDAELALFGAAGTPVMPSVLSQAASSSSGESGEGARCEYALLLARRQWLAVREARLRESVRERRTLVIARRAELAARHDALLQATVRLSGRRDTVVTARAQLHADVEALRRARRVQVRCQVCVRRERVDDERR